MSHPFNRAPLVGTCILRDARGDDIERVIVVERDGFYFAVQCSQLDRGGVRVLEVPRADVEFFDVVATLREDVHVNRAQKTNHRKDDK